MTIAPADATRCHDIAVVIARKTSPRPLRSDGVDFKKFKKNAVNRPKKNRVTIKGVRENINLNVHTPSDRARLVNRRRAVLRVFDETFTSTSVYCLKQNSNPKAYDTAYDLRADYSQYAVISRVYMCVLGGISYSTTYINVCAHSL